MTTWNKAIHAEARRLTICKPAVTFAQVTIDALANAIGEIIATREVYLAAGLDRIEELEAELGKEDA